MTDLSDYKRMVETPTLRLVAARERKMRKALADIANFAWSCVQTDCKESREELQRRINACKDASRL